MLSIVTKIIRLLLVSIEDLLPVNSLQACLADGDAAKAREWHFNERRHEFDGETAAAVVSQGREADVRLLLEFYEAGHLG